MNQIIEKELANIPFYQLHPEYKPFIGDRFDTFRILHVGESHFIPQQADEPDVFSITYFQNWWGNACEELKNCELKNCHNENGYKWGGWYRTKSVIENYINGTIPTNTYSESSCMLCGGGEDVRKSRHPR